jgi:hypothetical protein
MMAKRSERLRFARVQGMHLAPQGDRFGRRGGLAGTLRKRAGFG